MRFLTDFFAFKIYYFLAALLFAFIEDASFKAVLGVQGVMGQWIFEGVLSGVVAWLGATVGIEVTRNISLESEFSSSAHAWSRSTTAGSIFFIIVGASLATPATDFADPLSITMLALIGITAFTGGIVVYLLPFMDAGNQSDVRSIEALKAEQQVLTILFNGSIVATGVFIGGAVLGTSLGAASTLIKNRFPTISQAAIERITLFHAIAAAYVVAGTILWILRPLHRRLYQISREIHSVDSESKRPDP